MVPVLYNQSYCQQAGTTGTTPESLLPGMRGKLGKGPVAHGKKAQEGRDTAPEA